MSDDIKPILYTLTQPARVLDIKSKPGDKTVPGKLIFTFEIETDGKKKTERFKSSVFGKIKEILVNRDDTITTNASVVLYEPCLHPMIMKDMCAECGADLKKQRESGVRTLSTDTKASVSMVHSIPELMVTHDVAMNIGKEDEERLLKSRRLVLLVDLDQTLIHTTMDTVPPDLGKFHEEVRHFQLWDKGARAPWYHTKTRPGTTEFLNNIAPYYELHIVTFGARLYAHTIARILDPDEKLFSHRILSRDECFDPFSKRANLKALFPRGDSMVCIIDDREDVWNFAPNLVPVKPFRFFRDVGDINDPLGLKKGGDAPTSSDPVPAKKAKLDEVEGVTSAPSSDQPDDYLSYLEDILKRIHREFYEVYDKGGSISAADMKLIVPSLRKGVLKGVKMVFSGVVPLQIPLEKSSVYYMAVSLGAEVVPEVIPGVTHVVAARTGTAKLKSALLVDEIHVVRVEWLLSCAERWEHSDEVLFSLYSKKERVKAKEVAILAHAAEKASQDASAPEAASPPMQSADQASPQPMDAENEDPPENTNPLLSISKDDLERMQQEIDAEQSEQDSEQSDASSGSAKLRQKVLGYSTTDTSSENSESLSGEFPLGWSPKRKPSPPNDQHPEEPLDEEEEDANRLHPASSSSSEAGSMGSADEALALAIEREFLGM